MPTYRTRDQKTKKRGPRKYPKRLPRDPAKLFRWAAKGSLVDYEKLREIAKKVGLTPRIEPGPAGSHLLGEHEKRVTGVAISNDGQFLLTADERDLLRSDMLRERLRNVQRPHPIPAASTGSKLDKPKE